MVAEKKGGVSGINYGVLNELAGFRLRRAQLVAYGFSSEGFSSFGITPGLFGVLEIVRKNPGLTQTAVGQALGSDRSAMVSAIDKLEKRNLIKRSHTGFDRRSYALYLTCDGEEFVAKAEKSFRESNSDFLSVLSFEECELLFDFLERLTRVE
ncbi:MarR family winged helix-turn-helix transcriptional regulator [Pseudomonas sp. CES]|uniref:MarR family winged helix-turn-helix transcriptional regulator n=1 Tax=Pseudomonas sp. CES TaxID=2719586 RepID=UPI00146FEC05|nr:MarR family transcriptional regulator [Pseudomonas sp. CES]KAF4558108.1 MarR family transcriptional regulator [Pseudomonas sp. CES]